MAGKKAGKKVTGEKPESNEPPEQEEAEPEVQPRGNPRDAMIKQLAERRNEEIQDELGTGSKEDVEKAKQARAEQDPPDDGGDDDPPELDEEVPEIQVGHIHEVDGRQMVRVQDGSDVPYEDLLAGYAKVRAADQTFQSAARLREQAQHYYQEAEKFRKPSEQPKADAPDREALRKEMDDIAKARAAAYAEMEFDEAEKLEKQYNDKMWELVTAGGVAPQAVNVEEAVNRALAEREREREEQELGAAYQWYKAEHSDIANDPRKEQIMSYELEEARKRNPNASPQELFQEAAEQTRAFLGEETPNKDARQRRKETAASAPRRSSATTRHDERNRAPQPERGQINDDDMDKTRARRIQEIAAQRGRGPVVGKAPVEMPRR